MPADTIRACPDPACESSNIRPRVRSDLFATQRQHTYICSQCGHTFDEPLVRERRSQGMRLPRGGATLEEMDFDDLLADGGDA